MNKATRSIIRTVFVFFLCGFLRTATAQSDAPMPTPIQKGLSLYEKGGVIVAFDSWQHGGLLEGDATAGARLRAFKEMTASLGNYKSAEVIRFKPIGNNSRMVYIAMNFNRGALYAKFLIYHADTDWIIQNMNFSTRPETIMPWLALEGEAEGQ